MTISPSQAWAAACFVVFAAAGWLAGGGEEAAASPAASARAPTKYSERGARDRGKGAMPEDVRQRLASIRAARTPEERLRATLALANSLPVSEMERWYAADWFDFHDDMDSNLFYRITRSRWLAEDPEGLMTYFTKRDHDKTDEMTGLWTKRDPHAALAFMESLKNPADLKRFASAMAGPLAATDPATAMAQVLKLRTTPGAENADCLSQLISGLAKSAPTLLESESAAWPASLQKLAAASLTSASLERDFAGGVDGLRDAADGKKRFIQALADNRDLIKEMAKDPSRLPPGWFASVASENPYYVVFDDPGKWLDTDLAAMGFSEEQSRGLRSQAMGYLGLKDPERAFQLLAGNDLEDYQRGNIIQNTLLSLAHKDRAKAEMWAATLTDPKEIETARQAIESASAGTQAKAPPTPSEWLADLAGKDASAHWQYDQITRTWDREQIADAARSFAELPEDQKNSIATRLITGGQSTGPALLRAEAISHLLENPAAVDPGSPPLVQSASLLVASWGSQDPPAAGRWVASLPEGEARLWAAKNLAAQWAEYEPAAAREWVSSLPTGDRWEVVDYLGSGAAWKR